MKKMFSAKKVQMLTLMLLCGTTAVMAVLDSCLPFLYAIAEKGRKDEIGRAHV